MFKQGDIESAIADCERQLTRTRLRLSAVNSLKSSAPQCNEHDSVILREKVRKKGYVDESSIISALEDPSVATVTSASSSRVRRASLSQPDNEKMKDRIIRTFNLDEKRGLAMMRENGFCRTAAQTANFLLNTGGLNREMIGKALGR